MKRYFLLCTLFLATLIAIGQTQQGYVKTKGRLDAKGNLIHGQGLKGTTISVQGRTTVLVNADNGEFSFPAPEAQFRLDSVKKKGYQLVDMDACPRTYNYSKNPIYIVMETPEQQLQDQLAAERKLRRTLTDQLRQREDEIEAMKEQQKISDEEYRQALQNLYEDANQNDQLIKDMVDRYSKIDFDQLSEFDQLISNFIINGELSKADSLVNTKGNINERVSQYKKHEAINTREREELSQRQEQLAQSEALAIKERDDLANDIYHKYEIFKMQHLNDSAAYYLELRVSLDSTNVEWMNEAGLFILDYLAQSTKAMDLFQEALRQSLQQYGYENTLTAESYDNIAAIYAQLLDINQALEYCKKALTIQEAIYGENHPDIAQSHNNLGVIYSKNYEFDAALEHHNKALTIRQSLYGNSHPVVAISYDNIGVTYAHLGNYEKALNYMLNALSIDEDLLGEKHPTTAIACNNIGTVNSLLGNFETALVYCKKALQIQEVVLGENHPSIADSHFNIGHIYYGQGSFNDALENYNFSLNIWNSIYGEGHAYSAYGYNAIGEVYDSQGDFTQALSYFGKAIEIQKKTFGEDHPILAVVYNNVALVYSHQKEYDKALEWYNKVLTIAESTYGEDSPYVAKCIFNIASEYAHKGDYQKALENYYKALTIQELNYAPDDSHIIETKNAIKIIQTKIKETENK